MYNNQTLSKLRRAPKAEYHAYYHLYRHIFGCLTYTGCWFQLLWNILVSWAYYSQYMESHKIHVPNHQSNGMVIHPIMGVWDEIPKSHSDLNFFFGQCPRKGNLTHSAIWAFLGRPKKKKQNMVLSCKIPWKSNDNIWQHGWWTGVP